MEGRREADGLCAGKDNHGAGLGCAVAKLLSAVKIAAFVQARVALWGRCDLSGSKL